MTVFVIIGVVALVAVGVVMAVVRFAGDDDPATDASPAEAMAIPEKNAPVAIGCRPPGPRGGHHRPGGSGVVCLDSTPDDGTATEPACDSGGAMFAVKVFWKERGEVARLVLPVRP
mgnify:CR=1 FL=1